jgi:hypothetical protein
MTYTSENLTVTWSDTNLIRGKIDGGKGGNNGGYGEDGQHASETAGERQHDR